MPLPSLSGKRTAPCIISFLVYIFLFWFLYIYTIKEKHSLTRKLVGYRNRRQRWCKKEGNNETGKNPIFSTCKLTEPKEVLNIGFLSHFSFPKTLFPSFLHHLCLQFLYPTNFLVRECFSLALIQVNKKHSL